MPLEAVGVFAELRGHLLRLEERQVDYDRRIARLAQDETAQRLAEIPGVGPVTATAVVASVGDAKLFRNGAGTCGLGRPGTQAIQFGWENPLRADHQTWG